MLSFVMITLGVLLLVLAVVNYTTTEPEVHTGALFDVTASMTADDLLSMSSDPTQFTTDGVSFFNDLVPTSKFGVQYTLNNPDRVPVTHWGWKDGLEYNLACSKVQFLTSVNGTDWDIVDQTHHDVGSATSREYTRELPNVVNSEHLAWKCVQSDDESLWQLEKLMVYNRG